MKKRYIYLLSFFLPFVALLCGMIYMGVAPFGDKSLLIIDGLHQYMPFFSVLYDKLKSGSSLFYTFRTGLGVNFLSLFSYYLSSPLNLIIVFFSKNQLNMVVSWLIVVKLALSGLCAGIYFTAKSRKPGLHIVALACAYALNGYMVGYCWNVMWLDAIMIFPLIMLGIERLIEKKDGRLYGLTLFYALYCNYYMAFMICIFSVIWYILYHFTSVKQFFLRGIVFAIYSFVAAGMAAVILIPAYIGIKQTSSGESMILPLHSWLTGFWNLILRQFDMAYPITHDNFDGNANLYFGIFTLIFLVMYLLNREISLSEKIKKALLVIFFYVSFNEQILNFIWHGFHNQYGIPNRFSFLYGFVLIDMSFCLLEHMEGIRIWQPVVALAAGIALLAVSCQKSENELPVEVVISAIFLMVAYSAILFILRLDQKRRLFYETLLPTLMAGEMIVSCLMGFDSNGQITISKFFYATEDMEEATADLNDGSFYRSELAVNNIVDESTWYNMNAISLFGSTAKDSMVKMMDSLGFNTGCNEYLYKGSTPVTDLMLDLRYLYYHEGDHMTNGFQYVDTYGSMSVYENPIEGMSLGYAIDKNIDSWNYSSDYPFRVLNDFCLQGYNIDNIFEDIVIGNPLTNGCETTKTNDGEFYFEYESKQVDNLTFTLDFPEGSEDMYFFFDGSQVESTQISIDGLIVENGDFNGRMLNLGTIDPGSHVVITMSLKGEETTGYIRLSAATLNQEKYESLVDAMTSQSYQITKMSDSHIEGSFNADKDEYIFFSIPYDDGWTVTVDGKKAYTFPIGNAFLSVEVPKGEHTVVLDYTPGGFRIGLMITAGSIIIFLLLCVITHRKKKKMSLDGDMFIENDLKPENDLTPENSFISEKDLLAKNNSDQAE